MAVVTLASKARAAWLSATALTTLTAAHTTANPPDTYGLGARSSALAGAVNASSRDFSAAYYNPAGLARAPGTELTLGYLFAHHQLTLNGRNSDIDPVRGLVGGVVARGTVSAVPVAVALSAHLSDERLARVRTLQPSEPSWLRYSDQPQLLFFSPSIAARPLDWLSLGAGVAFLASTRGRFVVTGTAVQPDDSGRAETDSELRHQVDADLIPRPYPLLGVSVTPTDHWSLALVYRGQAQTNFAISEELSGEVQTVAFSVPAAYQARSRSTSAFIPRQVAVGINTGPLERWSIELDLTYVNWKAFTSPFSRTESELAIDVPPELFDLPGDTVPSRRLDPQFRDRVVPRFGLELWVQPSQALRMPVRGGYAFEKSPVPPQVGQTNFVDNDRHLFSLGSGFAWTDPAPWLPGELRLDWCGQWSHLPPRATLKTNPADFVGDYRAGGNIFAVGADLSLGFR